jgi:NAD(P)H-hydrate epimerase
LTKGGTGDAQAGLTTALFAKNNPFLAACAASYAVKRAGDELYQKVGEFYSADDLVDKLPEVLASL